ncbi:MAG: DUF4252 domain-containing protein [Odoribacteraceae bacterium]|jgi:hypothetical protein|nr:DUF4252 domain-containing protein [Odoribacteraceae bacterium]
MKRLFVFLIAALVSTMPVKSQIGQEMKAFRDKEGVTVTLLTPSLYSLYQKENLGRLPGEILKQLKEVNVLRVDRRQASPVLKEEMSRRFQPILDNEAKYALTESRQLPGGEERLYIHQQESEIRSLVLWSESEREIVLIELKGTIQPERARALSGILQVKGLERLAYILAPEQEEEILARDPLDPGDFLQGFRRRHRSPVDSLWPGGFFDGFGGHFDDMDAMIGQVEEMFERMRRGEGIDNGEGIHDSYSRGLEVTRENGKTRIKVNGSNVEVLYLIDGQVFAADSLTSIPDEIVTVDMLDAPDDPKKAYVVINTFQATGRFTGFSDGTLRFRHENQDYIFNIAKLPAPVLLVNNRPTRDFRVNPSDIIQIRPATALERALFGFPSIEVIIVTR